ncbi:MAG: hypothetical protein R2774_00360 [Saprospiraceae bacterium]
MTTITVKTSQQNSIFLKRLEYVLEFIQNHPLCPMGMIFKINQEPIDIIIHYGDISYYGFNMPMTEIFFFEKPTSKKLPKANLFAYRNFKILGFTSEKNISEFQFQVDIFQTIFFHISRWEEWNDDVQIDLHETMESKEQYLVKNQLHHFPIVDILILYFFEKLGMHIKDTPTKYAISHDIDAICRFPSVLKFVKAYGHIFLFHKNKLEKIRRLTKDYLDIKFKKKPDPYDTFNWLLVKSSKFIDERYIFFLVGGKTKFEGYFDISDTFALSIIEATKRLGYKIGIHPSYMSSDNKQLMSDQINLLKDVSGQNIEYSRQHFLRYKIQKTSEILEDLGIRMDSSLGFRDAIGFRCGTGFPYKLFNFKDEKSYNLMELPLIVMDMALIKKVQWNQDLFIYELTKFIENNRYNTYITFNFHNTSFDPILWQNDKVKKWYCHFFSK